MTQSTIVRAVADAHSMTYARAKALACHGFLVSDAIPVLAAKRRTFTFHHGESEDAFVRRLVADFPTLTPDNVAEFVDALKATARAKAARLPYDRLDQASSIIDGDARSDWSPAKPAALSKLIGGDPDHLAAYVRDRARRATTMVSSRAAICEALGFTPCSLDHLIELGLLKASRLNRFACEYDATQDGLSGTLTQRFWAMRPTIMGVSFFGHYASGREALRLTPDQGHPEGVLDATVDFLVSHDHAPTTTTMFELLAGDRVAIRAHLLKRHRAGDARVPRPPAIGPSLIAHPLSQLRGAAPQILKEVPGWALHAKGNAKAAPTSADVSTCVSISDPTLATIATTVALEGRLRKKDRYDVGRAISCLRLLWRELAGMDQTSPSATAATLAVVKIVADASTEDERWIMLRAITGWPHVVRIFSDALARKDLPTATRAALEAIAPVLPASGDDLFKAANTQSKVITVNRYRERVAEIDELLESARSFLPRLVRRREATQAFRAHVRATAKEALAEQPDLASLTRQDTFIEPAVPHGEHPRPRVITYRVHGWRRVLATLGRDAPRKNGLIGAYPWERKIEAWEAELFENRFAVEIVSCLHEDGSPAPEPTWFEAHRERFFWTPRQCSDEEYASRGEAMKRLRMTEYFRESHAPRLGEFDVTLAGIARCARRHLGMVLIPMEEHNHSEAFGLYHVSMRLDEPLRTDEFMQFNVTGDNAEHDVDEDGELRLAALKSVPKGYLQQREFTPSRHTERYAVDLTEITNERRYGGSGIPDVLRSGWREGRGPQRAAFLLAYGAKTLKSEQLTAATMTLLIGIHRLVPHHLKYLWNRLARFDGLSVEERRERQWHRQTRTTISYNPATRADLAAIRKEKLAISDEAGRLAHALQEGDQPPVSPGEGDQLAFERRRLRALREGYSGRGLGPAVARCDQELEAVERRLAEIATGTAA